MATPRELVDRLELSPHPEGGWYKETWRAPVEGGQRAASTAILFLLEAGQRSHWHRVDTDEIWLWHAGDPLLLRTARDEASRPHETKLGSDFATGQFPQAVVPRAHWQAAEPMAGKAGYALVSCVVAPAFSFDGFELAAPGWEPG